MFIRERPAEVAAWQRTRRSGDGFTFALRGGSHEVRLAPNADRSVELFLAVTEHFGPFGTLVVEDWRSGSAWHGDDLATSDVREALARARHVLTTHAGTPVTLTSDGESALLGANLTLTVTAPTDRWLYLLQGKGLQRVRQLRRRSWELQRDEFRPVPRAAEMIEQLVTRLGLAAADP